MCPRVERKVRKSQSKGMSGGVWKVFRVFGTKME